MSFDKGFYHLDDYGDPTSLDVEGLGGLDPEEFTGDEAAGASETAPGFDEFSYFPTGLLDMGNGAALGNASINDDEAYSDENRREAFRLVELGDLKAVTPADPFEQEAHLVRPDHTSDGRGFGRVASIDQSADAHDAVSRFGLADSPALQQRHSAAAGVSQQDKDLRSTTPALFLRASNLIGEDQPSIWSWLQSLKDRWLGRQSQKPSRSKQNRPKTLEPVRTQSDPYTADNLYLGKNEQHRSAITNASALNKLPPHILPALLAAERADPSAPWDPNAVNGDHVGIAQYSSDTWINQAERSGSYLNKLADSRGYLLKNGHVSPKFKKRLLSLRTDASISIFALADDTARNRPLVENLVSDHSIGALALGLYIAHHEGRQGAINFFHGRLVKPFKVLEGATNEAKARAYLKANGNDPNAAYQAWLGDFADSFVNVNRYTRVRSNVEVPSIKTLYAKPRAQEKQKK